MACQIPEGASEAEETERRAGLERANKGVGNEKTGEMQKELDDPSR